MSRRLALLATAVAACAACSGPVQAPPTPPHDDPRHVAPARGSDDDAVDAPPPPDAALPPRPLDQDLPRLVTRAVQMLQAIKTAFDAAGTDCAAATTKLGEVQHAYADLIEANAVVARADRKGELAAAMAAQQGALDAAAAAVVHAPIVGHCMDHPEFAAALDHALGAPAGAGP